MMTFRKKFFFSMLGIACLILLWPLLLPLGYQAIVQPVIHEPTFPGPSFPIQAASPKSIAAPSTLVGWQIQVGSFAKAVSAEALVTKLRQKHFSAYSLKVMVQGKEYHRVLVGPVATRKAAIELQNKLNLFTPVDSVVLQFDPVAH